MNILERINEFMKPWTPICTIVTLLVAVFVIFTGCADSGPENAGYIDDISKIGVAESTSLGFCTAGQSDWTQKRQYVTWFRVNGHTYETHCAMTFEGRWLMTGESPMHPGVLIVWIKGHEEGVFCYKLE